MSRENALVFSGSKSRPGTGSLRPVATEAVVEVTKTKLKLTVNETKTRVCHLPEEKFDFLGYTFGRCYSTRTGRAYLGTVPSKKRVQRICQAISDENGRNTTLLDAQKIAAMLIG